MQIKTIEKAIITKMDDWLSTIKDTALRKSVRESLIVSGGCITSMLLKEPVNDYDVYLQDINVVKALCMYYIEPFKDKLMILDGRVHKHENNIGDYTSALTIAIANLKPNQIKIFPLAKDGGLKVNEGPQPEDLKYYPLFFSPNAISLSHNLQIVIRFNGSVEEIHKSFDFIHATNYFTFNDGLVRNLPAIESILTKQLRYQGSAYPVTSIIRAKKFIKRGWNISAGELLKIMFQISNLNLSDPVVLEEQLIGVDVAYFDILINAMRIKYTKDPNFVMDEEYFNKLIDKIFNENQDEKEETA